MFLIGNRFGGVAQQVQQNLLDLDLVGEHRNVRYIVIDFDHDPFLPCADKRERGSFSKQWRDGFDPLLGVAS